MAPTEFDPNDSFTRYLIRRKARQLVGRAGFTTQDLEDLEQELATRLIKFLRAFDPSKAHRNAFTTMVVNQQVASILRHRRAQRRHHNSTCSLNVTINVDGDGPVELCQAITQREYDARRGVSSRDDAELVELASDIASLTARLPPSWQTLLERRKTRTMQQVSREMGIPRSTLNDWKNRIRARFEQASMRDYL
jgi:RNA polymerase sigma-70 factor (ECF subfamily)